MSYIALKLLLISAACCLQPATQCININYSSLSEIRGPGNHQFINWMGATRISDSTEFVWRNGDVVNSNFWCPGEPNNSGGREDHVTMIIQWPERTGMSQNFPCLNDFDGPRRHVYCVCEAQ